MVSLGFLDVFDASINHLQRQFKKKQQQQSHLVGKETTHQENAILATQKVKQVAVDVHKLYPQKTSNPVAYKKCYSITFLYVFQVSVNHRLLRCVALKHRDKWKNPWNTSYIYHQGI